MGYVPPDADREPWTPWAIATAIVLLAYGSFCLGMCVGQSSTFALMKASKQIEAEPD